MDSKHRKLLILQGPPGCGKNAMINAYAAEKGLDVIRFKNIESLLITDQVKSTSNRLNAYQEKVGNTAGSDELDNMINFVD